MAGYIKENRFHRDASDHPRFKFTDPYFHFGEKWSDAAPRRPLWLKQWAKAERIDPEPTDIRALQSLQPDNKHPSVPNFLRIGSVPVVCDAFKRMVLELESNKHQFVAVKLQDEEQVLPGNYWIMNVLQCVDVVIDPRKIERWHGEGQHLPEVQKLWRTSPDGRTYLDRSFTYVDGSLIQGLHLFRPRPVASGKRDLFLSDELLHRTERAQLGKPDVYPVVEVAIGSLR